jgi:hypothetical protein
MGWFESIEEDYELLLPHEIDQDSKYKSELARMLKYFIGKVSSFALPTDLSQNILKVVNLLIGENCLNKGVVDFYYEGKIADAIKKLEEIVDIYLEYPLAISTLENSFAFKSFVPYLADTDPYKIQCNNSPLIFFKARLSERIYHFSAFDLLHIPFNDRYKASGQRFSLAGIPCMYFGTTPYICWMELGRPSNERFNAAAFKLDDNFKILNLRCSWTLICDIAKDTFENIKSIDKEKVLYSLLILWPLVCATSFRVKNGIDRVFRSEYMISQLLMLAIQSKNIDGIGYISKQIPFDANPYPHCMNLVLIAKYNDAENFSEYCRRFEIHKPVNMGEFYHLTNDVKHRYCIPSFIESSNFIVNNIYLDQKAFQYQHTDFYSFDKYLRAEQIMTIK